MKKGKGKHLVFLHLYTGYKITDKPISEMTLLQYQAILRITEEIVEYKRKNKPLVVI